MDWIFLILAGAFEMTGVAMISRLHRERNWQSFLYLLGCFGGSFLFLALAMKNLPMGTAYAIWTGIGTAGGALLGIMLYGESKDWRRIFFILLVLGAAIGLKVVS